MRNHPFTFLGGALVALLAVIALRGSLATPQQAPAPVPVTPPPVQVRHTIVEPDVPPPAAATVPGSKSATETETETESETIAIAPELDGEIIDLHNARCPVMGGKAKETVSTDWNGLRIHWCCEGCFEAFSEDPAAHLAKFGIGDVEAFKAGVRAEGGSR